jgi:alpha-D-xyloside xylohydrolase
MPSMKMISYHTTPNGLSIETSQGTIQLIPYTANIIRVLSTWEPSASLPESLMIVTASESGVEYEVQETLQTISLLTSAVEVQIQKETAAFAYFDRQGRLLTREPARGGKTLVPAAVLRSVVDETTGGAVIHGADGPREKQEAVKQLVDRKAFHTTLEFVCSEGEALYGLGSHEEGFMNLRGTHQDLYQHNLKAVVPMLVSTQGYSILVDCYSFMTFHDDEQGFTIWCEVQDALDFYFLCGPEFDQIIHGYRWLTGKAPMLPRWAFGYLQSKERYKTQEELLAIVKEYRQRHIPLDAIILDWQSWPGDMWGQKSLDPERFPQPQTLLEELHRLQARLIVSIWPRMTNHGPNHQQMLDQGFLLGDQMTYDAFDAQARALYWKQTNEGLFSLGVDGWWCDCTEPFEADWHGSSKPEPDERCQINTEEAKKYLDSQYMNAYSLQHSLGIYEGQRSTTESKRVFDLTRSAYAGQQRYGTITWSGDIAANWLTLKRQIAAGVNFCATGLPYWTTDIGAFFVTKKDELWFWDGAFNEGYADLGYREFYVRFFQYGTFLPLFRAHGTDIPREVWRFGEPGSPFYDTLVKFIRLRYHLLPYLYSLAGWVTQEDYTMLRALAFDFRHDPHVYNVADQYLFGPAFLVNPVTEPMYYAPGSQTIHEHPKTRPVYLPAGSDWYDFWTGARFSGAQTLEAAAPLELLPLFVRAGSIVPFGPAIQSTAEIDGQTPLLLRIYPGQDGHFTLYEDEGDTYQYESGAFATIAMHWDDTEKRLLLGKRQGEYAGMPTVRRFFLRLVSEQHGIGMNSSREGAREIIYDGNPLVIEMAAGTEPHQ